MITRVIAETEAVTRCGPQLMSVRLDGSTFNGTNVTLNSVFRTCLADIGIQAAAATITDADIGSIPFVAENRFHLYVEMRCLQTVLSRASFGLYAISGALMSSEDVRRIALALQTRIDQIHADLVKPTGVSLSAPVIGQIITGQFVPGNPVSRSILNWPSA